MVENDAQYRLEFDLKPVIICDTGRDDNIFMLLTNNIVRNENCYKDET